MQELCWLSRSDCFLGFGDRVPIYGDGFVCMSGESVYVLFRVRMSLESFDGLVLYEIVLRRCLHAVDFWRASSSRGGGML